MDFFEYASVASAFVNTLWMQLLVGALCFAIVFIFQAIALYTIAAREGYGNKWMAFIPFLNTYYIGVCAQKNKFNKFDPRYIGIIAAALEFVLVVLYVVYYVACYLVIDYEIPVNTVNALGMSITEYRLGDDVPANLAWAAWMYNYLNKYILNFVDLIFVILQFCLLLCFFQTYACRRYILFTVASILFPIQGILFFVLRNNKAINYKDFVRAEQARQYRMYQQYQQQQNYYQNPYNPNPDNPNPYENGAQNRSQGKTDDPFEDLGSSENSSNSGGSPFEDFDE